MATKTIVDVGKFLQGYGLKIGEHPAFGGVAPVHAKGSYHYEPGGAAIDVTDWRKDLAPSYPGGTPKDWKTRTGELSWRAKQLGTFNEVFGPGDKGHDTHVHLALSGSKPLSDQQLEWLATGRYKTPEGKLTDVMPGAVAAQAQQPQQAQTTALPKSAGDTYIILPGSGVGKTPNKNDFLLDYINQSGLLSSSPNIKSSFDPLSMLSNAFNQTPNYLA